MGGPCDEPAPTLLFVCTGNICRSPTAEAIAADVLGDGVRVESAGLFRLDRSPASPHAVTVAAEIGVDLSRHAARALSPQIAERADRIYVMTRAHRRELLAVMPHLSALVELLDPGGRDIQDPYGRGLGVYRRSRDHIREAVGARLEEWRSLADDRRGAGTGTA